MVNGMATTPGIVIPTASDNAPSKRDLTTWWRSFKHRGLLPKSPTSTEAISPPGIFGVPLHQSIRYANVAISLLDEHGQSYIYGYVPIVVAKCGIFLKANATEVEGIFRLAGSEKRIKDLKAVFDSPDKYGKNLEWTGYTVHDAANVLRRYLNKLPEPIIPLDFYERFRSPIKTHQPQQPSVVPGDSRTALEHSDFDVRTAIRTYQSLITELSPLNRQLLLYILDLLAVFAGKAEFNKMTNANLAAIFQPCILSHPQHDMEPHQYLLSQEVLIFLIENQDSFLIGMHGTAADEKTVNDVQSGGLASTKQTSTASTKNKSMLGRSSSNASAGGENVRRWGNLRRNASVSSKDSPTALSTGSPALSTRTSGSGVQRSNTVPSGRSAGVGVTSPRFSRGRSVETTSDAPGLVKSPVSLADTKSTTPTARESGAPSLLSTLGPGGHPVSKSASSSETVTPAAALTPIEAPSARQESRPVQIAPTALHINQETQGEPTPATASANSSRIFMDMLKKSPGSEAEKRESKQPKKLQKKRRDGHSMSSANSSLHDLGFSGEEFEGSSTSKGAPGRVQPAAPVVAVPSQPGLSDQAASHAQEQGQSSHGTATDATIRPRSSSALSTQSHATTTDTSDGEMTGSPVGQPKPKRLWRFSKAARTEPQAVSKPSNPSIITGSSSGNDLSKTTVETRESQGTTSTKSVEQRTSPTEHVMSDSEDRKRGPVSWIKTKLAERKDKEGDKKGQTPAKSNEGSPVEVTPSTLTSEVTSAHGNEAVAVQTPTESRS